jgi:iron(III) transport system ATP-binding protein
MTELVVRNVYKQLGDQQVLSGASFTARQGEIVALLGASGSGKTTLLRSIAGLEEPEQGLIEIGGKPVLDASRKLCLPPEKRAIGLVFQSYALWPHMNVRDNVAYGLKLRGVASAEREERVQTILDHLGLGHLAARFPHQLSGGQQQRVAICRALVYNPKVLLLDEPLSNLDAKLREEARFWIRQLILQFQICAVVVTHDQSEALAMSDNVLLLSQGLIVQEGTPQDIYTQPNSLFSAEFMGTNNLIKGHVRHTDGDRAEFAGNNWTLKGTARSALTPGVPVSGVIRVERVRIENKPGPNRLPMAIEGCAYLGEYWEYLLRHDDITLRARGAVPLRSGETWCELPEADLWIYPSHQADVAAPAALGVAAE